MVKQYLLIALTLASLSSHAVELSRQNALNSLTQNNLQIAASKFNIDINRAEELTAGLWANPTLLVDSQLMPLSSNWNQTNTGGPTQRDFILTVPVDVNGKRRQAVTVAKLATKVSEAYFQNLIRDKGVELLNALYHLEQIRNDYQVLNEKKELLEKSVATLERRFGSGNIQPLVQNRARLALDEARLQLRQMSLDEKKEENNIRLLLNIDPSEAITLKLNPEVRIDKKLPDLKKMAMQERPDFRAVDLLKRQMKEQISLEERRIWDDFLVQGGFSRQESVNRRPGDPDSTKLNGAWSWVVGVIIPIPVFDRNQGSIMAAKVQENQVEVRSRFMERELETDLIDSLKSLETHADALKLYKKDQLQNAKLVRDSALRQFGAGASTLIEYLDAVDAYHSTISNYLRLQYEWNAETINLKYLSGMPL